MGLAICKQLCDRMGGNIHVEGSPGRGSKFTFTVVVNSDQTRPQQNVRNAASRLDGKRLLAVDDNATNRIILAEYARGWGMEVTTVKSGDEALRCLATTDTQFDVIIVDYRMPEMNGVTLAERIHATSQEQPPRIVLLGSASAESGEDNDELFAATLLKPLKPQRLRETLDAALGLDAPTISAAASPDSRMPKLAARLPLRILVAEDNPVNQRVARGVLTALGYEPHVVADGAEALHAAQSQNYDLIFMDVQMPRMDGLEATKRILDNPLVSPTPKIVAMTAGVLKSDREDCLAAGMIDHLAKPLDFAAVAETIERVVG